MTTDQVPSEIVPVTDAILDETPDVDVDALNAALSAAGDEAQAKVDIANIKRAVGHIPGLQKSLDSVTKEIGRISNLERSNAGLTARFDALLDAIPEGMLTTRAADSLRPVKGESDSAVLAKIAELEARLQPAAQEQTYDDPAQAVWRAQLDTAQVTVSEYAKKVSFDVDAIPDAVYQRALSANNQNVSLATVDVIKYIDAQTAAAGRRAERIDAGSGGTGGRSTRTGPVTLDQIKNMTVDEVRRIPAAERMAAV